MFTICGAVDLLTKGRGFSDPHLAALAYVEAATKEAIKEGLGAKMDRFECRWIGEGRFAFASEGYRVGFVHVEAQGETMPAAHIARAWSAHRAGLQAMRIWLE